MPRPLGEAKRRCAGESPSIQQIVFCQARSFAPKSLRLPGVNSGVVFQPCFARGAGGRSFAPKSLRLPGVNSGVVFQPCFARGAGGRSFAPKSLRLPGVNSGVVFQPCFARTESCPSFSLNLNKRVAQTSHFATIPPVPRMKNDAGGAPDRTLPFVYLGIAKSEFDR